MTVEVVRGRAPRGKDVTTEQVAIGEADANIFNCPRCSRPLAVGNSRCAGCGQRMVAGVPLGTVSGFVAAGLVIGLLVGGGGVAAVTALTRPVDKPLAQAPTTVVPTAAAVAPSVALPVPAPAVDPALPASAVSALRQTTTLNQRLMVDADRLAVALASDRPSGADIAPLLRTLASTASFGDRLAPSVAGWSDGAAVSQRLAAFYTAVGSVAEEGLAASVQNSRAYVDAGKRMLVVLRELTDLDAASRSLAATADIELPPLLSDGP